ncbi:MAG TPA: type VI secretion system baseplate subunit TssG [candidate division Zixibacteria bacterium]
MNTKINLPYLTNPHSPTSLVRAFLWLRKLGIDPENLRLLFKGPFENYKGEITGQIPLPGEVNTSKEIQLEVALASMVDQLPFSFFLDPNKKQKDLEKTELRSRELLAAFDSMMAQTNTTLEYIHLAYKYVISESSFTRLLIGAFGFPQEGWDSEELLLWMFLLPYFHQWAGTIRGTSRVLSIFLKAPVRIRENQRGENSLPIELQSLLGRRYNRLGSDWSLGKGFSECDTTFQVVIGPISASEVRDFLPPGIKKIKLDLILTHCVPGQLRWKMKVTLKPKERNFTLGESTPNCVLGYSSYLRN